MFYTIFNTSSSTSRQEGRVKTLGTLSDKENFHPTPLIYLGNKFTGRYSFIHLGQVAIMSEKSCPRIEPNDSNHSFQEPRPLSLDC